MKRKLLLVACLSLLAATGAYFWKPNTKKSEEYLFLKNSDTFVFYSLKEAMWQDWSDQKPPMENFHDRAVLGKVVITDPAEKTALINALFNGLNPSRMGNACHEPRHAIRAVRGNRTLDLTICFMCQNVDFYLDNGGHKEEEITESAKALFNQTLRKHHLPLAKE